MRAFVRPLFAAAALAAGLALAACNGGGDAAPAQAPGEMSLGNANAPVTVIEYASVTCGACAQFNQQTYPEFKRRYIDTGRVRYVLREFLTPPTPVAAQGFLLARCAGPDRYFGVVDALFRGQQEMFQSGDTRGTLLRIAQSAGLTEQQFQTCLRDDAALEALNARVESAQDAGIISTPTFLVNGRKIAEGAIGIQELSAAIDPLLTAAGQPVPAAPATANPTPAGAGATAAPPAAPTAVAPTTAGPVTATPAPAPAQ